MLAAPSDVLRRRRGVSGGHAGFTLKAMWYAMVNNVNPCEIHVNSIKNQTYLYNSGVSHNKSSHFWLDSATTWVKLWLFLSVHLVVILLAWTSGRSILGRCLARMAPPKILQRSALPRWLSSLARKIGSTQLLGGSSAGDVWTVWTSQKPARFWFNWVKNGEDVPGLENHTLFKVVSSFFEHMEKKHRIFGIGRGKCEIWMKTNASAVRRIPSVRVRVHSTAFSLRCTKLSCFNWT